jgi:NAD(P)-dependent dehydrogenase (short-subunit alcohol dehydrogenase family)
MRLGRFENAGPIINKFAPDFAEWFLRETPMHRCGKADEAAAAGLYLASGASNYVTGIVLPISGGIAVIRLMTRAKSARRVPI